MQTWKAQWLVALVVALTMIILPSISWAGESASFESFYRNSRGVNWYVAAGLAILAGGIVFAMTAPAGAIVTGIGTWLGGLSGYSGIAATNYGLALLGGGSIASGGLGIVGGTAVLTAVLSFSTDVVIDYATKDAFESFQYGKFAEASRQMTTLPIPRNGNGPKGYEEAMEILEQVDQSQGLASPRNRSVLLKAIEQMNKVYLDSNISIDERVRNQAMLGLLYFTTDKYMEAKIFASLAVQIADREEIESALPMFILATSLLYDEEPDLDRSLKLFQDSVLDEPRNPLVPLLFSVYLDRLMYRIDGEQVPSDALLSVAGILDNAELGKQWVPAQMAVLWRFIIRLGLEQQKIDSLSSSSNLIIRNSPKTLSRVKRALNDYTRLLEGAQFLSGGLAASAVLDKADPPKEFGQLRELVSHRSQDRQRLQTVVAQLEAYQREVPPVVAQLEAYQRDVPPVTASKWQAILAYLGLIAVAGWLIVWLTSSKRTH